MMGKHVEKKSDTGGISGELHGEGVQMIRGEWQSGCPHRTQKVVGKKSGTLLQNQKYGCRGWGGPGWD